MAPLTIEAQTLLKITEDCQWHKLETIIGALARTVAPGRALRRSQENRERNLEKKGGYRGVRRLPTEDEMIVAGQRACALTAYNSLKKRWFEERGGIDEREIRRRPAPVRIEGDGKVVLSCNVPEHHGLPGGEPSTDDDKPVGKRQAPTAPPELPGCPSCGFYVTNAEQHAEFHKAFDRFLQEESMPTPKPGPAPKPGSAEPQLALVDEAHMRRLIREEVLPLVSEQYLRRILAEELVQVLDGMLSIHARAQQRWLIGRFAALEEILGQKLPGSSPFGIRR